MIMSRAAGAPLLILSRCFCAVILLLAGVGTGSAQTIRFEPGWVAAVRTEALAAGVAGPTFDRVFATLTPDCRQPGVTCADAEPKGPPQMPPHLRGLPQSCNRVTQAEFVHPARYFPERNLANLASRGRSIVASWRKDRPEAYAKLQEVSRETGVSIPVLVALWGRETGFGSAKLPHNAIRALASLARFGAATRRDWARGQLIAALKMVEDGHATPERMHSSWAGAIGLTQLTPEEFLEYAIDADGDGRLDIWNSEIDALASTANVLRHRGWRGDLGGWGHEISMPGAGSPFDCTLEGRFTRKSFREWVEVYGLARRRQGTGGAPLPFPRLDQEGYVVMPAGTLGPAFLVTQNFDVLRSYNTSDNYSIFVGHVADRIGCRAGSCGFGAGWPPQDTPGGFGFSVANLCRLQLALKERGFYPGEPDGLFGGQTRVAIGRYQKSIGQAPTCFPTASMFETLNASASSR
jgi:lytic murein transglycosylase